MEPGGLNPSARNYRPAGASSRPRPQAPGPRRRCRLPGVNGLELQPSPLQVVIPSPVRAGEAAICCTASSLLKLSEIPRSHDDFASPPVRVSGGGARRSECPYARRTGTPSFVSTPPPCCHAHIPFPFRRSCSEVLLGSQEADESLESTRAVGLSHAVLRQRLGK